MNEFGLEKFEILLIRKEFHLLSNLMIFKLGVLELCISITLLL